MITVHLEPHKQYGSTDNNLLSPKDTLVKYEFNTVDEDGNKVMDKLNKDDAMKMLNHISKQYGDNVIVEFSGDALDAIKENVFKQRKKETNEAYTQQLEERNALFQECLKQNPALRLHRIIPNIQTDHKLVKSLEGVDDNIEDAAYDIIYGDLIPHNIGNMSEDERQGLISLGMEKAKYLADNHLNGDQAKQFMEAMETIAKYGVNGKVSANGKVTYNIKEGPRVGAPDDAIGSEELMKSIDPELYKNYKSMLVEAAEKNDSSLEMKAAKMSIDWHLSLQKNHPGKAEGLITDFKSWKKDMEDTEVAKIYNNTDRSSIQGFVDSIIEQDTLFSSEFLADSLAKFAEKLKK